MKKADFNKNPDGLLPAIVQDSKTQKINNSKTRKPTPKPETRNLKNNTHSNT